MRQVHGKLICETLEEMCDPRASALLVIDMQNDAVDVRGKLRLRGHDTSAIREIAPRCGALIESARELGVMVIHVRVVMLEGGLSDSPAWIRARKAISGTDEFFVEGSWGAEFCRECIPQPEELVITKYRSSAFVGTNLDQVLRSNGIETVVIIGEQTPGCIEATVRDASHHDYYAVLVEDCVAALDPQLHEASLTVLRTRHDVTTAARVIAAWRGHREIRQPGGPGQVSASRGGVHSTTEVREPSQAT